MEQTMFVEQKISYDTVSFTILIYKKNIFFIFLATLLVIYLSYKLTGRTQAE